MEMERTQNWLVEEVKKETGLSFDSFYLDRIMKGKAKYAGRPEEAICKILGIEKTS